ncbi:disease resistance protein RPM1-like [Arachis hypogaea]|uniref:disease resistance protein RPM1-like n=1 Tax=Arachis hypogaea TaxID=3818 RepID=UPI000DED11FD|nr:disease resistance protein RPM1-like [Arachis hypogaea]
MAEIAVNLVVDKLIPLLKSEAKLLSGVRGQIESISKELRLMRAYLRDVDTKAEMEAQNSDQSRKEWVAQIRQVSIRIQDVIDLYLYKVANKPRRGRRNAVAGVLCKICDLLKSYVPRHEIASEIGEIRESINRLKEAGQLYGHSEAAAESSGGRSSPQRHYLRLRANFAEEEELVGIEHAKKELNNWLSEGGAGRTVIAVVGEGGLGKTILVRNVYKQEQQKHSFDCYGWVDVSRSLKGVQLFKTLLRSFHDRKESNVDKNLHALIEDTREYLKEKKYLIVLDDVWETDLWGTVELALPKNNGMIMITTRDTGVADSCKVSAKVHTYPLKPLEPENALRLFHSKAFQSGSKNPCEALMKLSEEFTKKCDGVPLAIVAIASLLSTKKERLKEWKAVYNSLQSKLASDSHLKGYHQALSESYQDLSYHLKSCLLYFGLFPEQYAIKRARLINLWIAEGFVECREHQTQQEVGEEYLAELIARSLVKVADVNTYGRVRKCRVHDLMHDFIVKKCEEFNFCQVKKGNPFCFDKWSRRLSIGTNVDFADLRTSADRNQCSLLRSFLLYDIIDKEEMISTFVNSLFSNFKLLVTLHFENIPLAHLPETIGNFVHLKYLNLRHTNIETIPKSIGKLRNLETLDLKETNVSDLPVEIYSLTKLCYLNVHTEAGVGVKLKRGVANLTALQKLAWVDASDVVGELKNLKQLRSLKIRNLVEKDGMWLCNAIESMTNLCSLSIKAKDNEILELESLTSPPPHLERLCLFGSDSEMVPDWVFRLKNLIRLDLVGFKFTQDQLCLVGRQMPELMRLYVRPFEGDELNIQKGWFRKLRSLTLADSTLKAIRIDEGSLPCLLHLFLPYWHRNLEEVQVPDHVRKLLHTLREIWDLAMKKIEETLK